MKTCEFLFLVIAVFLDIFSCTCVASKVCPVRAVPIAAPEGVKCVCGHGYFGKNCRFKGQNVLALDADWVSVDLAQVTWRTETEFVHVFTRRVQFHVSGLPIYAKWRAGVRVFNGQRVGDEAKYRENATPTEIFYLRLNSAFSYEIRLTSSAEKNNSSSIFLDSQLSQAIALQSETESSNSTGEDECRHLYSCPEERWFNFVPTFFKDFKKTCFKTGMVIGVMIGIAGTLLLSSLIYAAIRLCIHCFAKKKTEKKTTSLPPNTKPKACVKSISSPELCKLSRSENVVNVVRSRSLAECGSVIIDIPAPSGSNFVIQHADNSDIAESKSVRSVAISMPADGEHLSDVRDAGSVSIL